MIVNLTPHEAVVIHDDDRPNLRLDSVGVIRVPTEVRRAEHGEPRPCRGPSA